MPTNKQKRDVARRHLERQLKRRAEREAARRRFTIIGSVLGTIVLVVAIVAAVALIGHKDKTKNDAGATPPVSSSAAPTSPSASPTTSYPKATGATVTFGPVTVTGATDLKGYPTVTSKGTTNPTALQYKDLVVGKGLAPTAAQTVTVQYVGVLYKKGVKPFDSSWGRGSRPASPWPRWSRGSPMPSRAPRVFRP